MSDYLVRFLIGGAVVSLFAIGGSIFKPKSFAGLFAAAPSVALVGFALAFAKKDRAYASIEGRSMILGAIAFIIFSGCVWFLVKKMRWHSLPAALTSLLVWFAIAIGLQRALLGGSG